MTAQNDGSRPDGRPDDAPAQHTPGQGPAGDGWGQASGAPAWGSPVRPDAGPPPAPTGWDQQQPGYDGRPGQYGQYGQGAPQDGGFGPLVGQPGIVPLRPLTLGEIYDGAFRAIRANPVVMFGFAAVVVTLLTVLQAALTWSTYEDMNALAGQPMATDADLEELYGTLVSSLTGSLVAAALSFVVTTILNGLLIHSVSQSVIGRKVSLGEVWALARPQLLKLLLLTLVISLLVAAAVLLCLVPGIAVTAAGSLDAGVVLILLGALVAIPAALVVITGTVLATPTLVLERAGVITALRRAWRLTRPTFWRVLGIYLLTAVLVFVVSLVITGPISALGPSLGDATLQTALQFATATVAAAITTPVTAGVISLLYIDVRIRQEGLDVELAAAAQES